MFPSYLVLSMQSPGNDFKISYVSKLCYSLMFSDVFMGRCGERCEEFSWNGLVKAEKCFGVKEKS